MCIRKSSAQLIHKSVMYVFSEFQSKYVILVQLSIPNLYLSLFCFFRCHFRALLDTQRAYKFGQKGDFGSTSIKSTPYDHQNGHCALFRAKNQAYSVLVDLGHILDQNWAPRAIVPLWAISSRFFPNAGPTGFENSKKS